MENDISPVHQVFEWPFLCLTAGNWIPTVVSCNVSATGQMFFFWFTTEIFICITQFSCNMALRLVKGIFQWVLGNCSSCFFPFGSFYIEAKKLLYVQLNGFHHNCHDWHFSLKWHLTLSRLKGNEALFSDVLNHFTDLVDKNGAVLPSSLQLKSQEAVMLFIQERHDFCLPTSVHNIPSGGTQMCKVR